MNVDRQLPQYRSHKKVWALKIADISNEDVDGNTKLAFVEEGYGDRFVSAEYMAKHKPEVGGYWVQYAGGYESWSPAGAFESGYTRVP
jgi:hypothetical protein